MSSSSSGSLSNETDLDFIERITCNCHEVQGCVLHEILSKNADTEYLSRHLLGGATDRERFKSKIPIVTYDDIRPDIQRIANGDRSPILCHLPIKQFYSSSGTSGGECKLYPATVEDTSRRIALARLVKPILDRYASGLQTGKQLFFRSAKAEGKTPGGFPCIPVLTSLRKSEQYKKYYQLSKTSTSPFESIICPNATQSMYIQMLCGLLMREQVVLAGSAFTSSLLRAIQFLQIHWKQFTRDIESGTLSPEITEPSLRTCMEDILTKPDPQLAESIAKECINDSSEGIIKRIWPNVKVLQLIATGSHSQYIPLLDYYSNGVPIFSPVYTSSECFFGLNLRPFSDEACYCIMPNMGYFEFIPLNASSGSVVEIGKDYEVVVTNYCGLYRYKMGDILRVVRFYNKAPEFKFMGRKNTFLSVDGEATSESDLQNAVVKVSQLLQEFDATILDYTSYADTMIIPGHYVIFMEFNVVRKQHENDLTDDVFSRCCLEMEEVLSESYRRFRVEGGSIGPLEIRS